MNLPDFPINACLPELAQALQAGHVILSASTGSGKTTIVPLSLLDQPWLQGRKIIMLEPRRPAARMAARRMAYLHDERVGETIGYQVRLDRQVSAKTRIEVLTEGLLLRRLQSDPELSAVGLIIFDEFHERNLVADLSLSLCIDICKSLRDDLRLLVMSATLDSNRLVELLAAQHIHAEGRLYPVKIHYSDQTRPVNESVDACLPLIGQALETVQKDVLVFLPGQREIKLMQELAVKKWGHCCEVLTLFGDQLPEQQDKVLNPQQQSRRRLILSTDIAETSLTIAGVEAVVDSGRVRKPVFQASSGLTRLETRWISKASAMQRTGRAGRLGPGHCFRAWSEGQESRLVESIPAEITQADLADTVLELAAWGVTDPDSMAWLDKPPQAHWRQAVELLQRLEAVDGSGQLTRQGSAMFGLPVHPRLAHMLTRANSENSRQMVADMAALLSDRDLFTRAGQQRLPLDLNLRLHALQEWRKGDSLKQVSVHRLRQVDRLSKQFLSMLGPVDKPLAVREYSAGAYLAMAYPDRIAKRRSSQGSYLMSNGRGVTVAEDDSLASQDYLVIADLDAGQRDGRAWLAAPIAYAEIHDLFAGQINNQRQLFWDAEQEKVVARQTECLDSLVLNEMAVPVQQDDVVVPILIKQLRIDGFSLLGEQPAFNRLRARIATLRLLEKDADWPDVSDAALLEQLEMWLQPWLDGVISLKQLKRINLMGALQAWLGWDRQQRLDSQLPEVYLTPAGTRRTIEYDMQNPPRIEVPLQEVLGESKAPAVAQGRLKLVIHLLSPAARLLQVTSDLEVFWKGAYDEVKKEMRGRYPKHYWPDDPANAQATRFTKKKMNKTE